MEYLDCEFDPSNLGYIVTIGSVEWVSTGEYGVDFEQDREHIDEEKEISDTYSLYFYLDTVMKDYDGKEPEEVENNNGLYRKLYTRLMNDFDGKEHNLYDEEHLIIGTESFKRYIQYDEDEYILRFVNEEALD